MIVISDTTPLRYLTVLGMQDLLPRLFERVHCPEAVIRECLHPNAPAILREWANQPYMPEISSAPTGMDGHGG